MAVRLSVVMVHSTPATPKAERVAQGVVGELIGLNGIDLVLVAPLDSLSDTSTDRLTLSSLAGDIAVLDWRLPGVMHESLKRVGVEGSRTRHAADPEVAEVAVNPDVQSRKLYLFNLTEFTTAEAVISSITKLNDSRAVRTFSLAPIVKRSGAGESAQSGGPRVVSQAVTGMPSIATPEDNPTVQAAANDDPSSQELRAGSSMQGQAAEPTRGVSSVSSISDPDDDDLDALIDQLDQLDP